MHSMKGLSRAREGVGLGEGVAHQDPAATSCKPRAGPRTSTPQTGYPCRAKAMGTQRKSPYHEVLHPIAELVNEQDGEVVHSLPQLDPGG